MDFIENELVMDTANWMGNYLDIIGDYPINNIYLPGTRNSGAYHLDLFNTQINDDKSQAKWWFKHSIKLGKKSKKIKSIIKDWTLCQTNTVYKQLQQGIRYLDLHFSLINDEFYLTNYYTLVPIEEVLLDIHKFLKKHKQEILVLNFYSSDNNLYVQNIDQIYKIIKDYLRKDGLYPRDKDYSFPTLSEMININKRVILYLSSFDNINYFRIRKDIWSNLFIQNPSITTSKVDKKIGHLKSRATKVRKTGYYLNCLSFTIDPVKKDIVKDIKHRLLTPCAYRNKSLYWYTRLIQNQLYFFLDKRKYMKNVSIIITDFPTTSLIQRIIILNEKNRKI